MALPNLHGRAALILPEDDFDVDQIIGIANIKIQDVGQLSQLALAWCDAEFGRRLPGDLLIGGRNFGYGHPHYPSMITMRHLGIAAVIAESFSPGYLRGEISRGFPQVACPGILSRVGRWDELAVDWSRSELTNLTRGVVLPFERLPAGDMVTLEAGGLLALMKNRRRDYAGDDAATADDGKRVDAMEHGRL